MTEAAGDFIYCLNDLYRHYFGAGLSYAQMLQSEEVPPRFKALIRAYLLGEVGAETTLESHLYYLREGQVSCELYTGLQARVRITRPQTRRNLFGREETLFKEEIVSVGDLIQIPAADKQRQGIQIREVQIPKRKLREFTL